MSLFSFREPPSRSDVDTLRAILSRCSELIAESNDSDWSCMDTVDILKSLDAGLSALTDDGIPDVNELGLLFAPTGALQETAMSNGWSDEYLELSSRFDNTISKWR